MSRRKQNGEEQPQDREETHRWANGQVEESQAARRESPEQVSPGPGVQGGLCWTKAGERQVVLLGDP